VIDAEGIGIGIVAQPVPHDLQVGTVHPAGKQVDGFRLPGGVVAQDLAHRRSKSLDRLNVANGFTAEGGKRL
jgi:hypothetical protein